MHRSRSTIHRSIVFEIRGWRRRRCRVHRGHVAFLGSTIDIRYGQIVEKMKIGWRCWRSVVELGVTVAVAVDVGSRRCAGHRVQTATSSSCTTNIVRVAVNGGAERVNRVGSSHIQVFKTCRNIKLWYIKRHFLKRHRRRRITTTATTTASCSSVTSDSRRWCRIKVMIAVRCR